MEVLWKPWLRKAAMHTRDVTVGQQCQQARYFMRVTCAGSVVLVT